MASAPFALPGARLFEQIYAGTLSRLNNTGALALAVLGYCWLIQYVYVVVVGSSTGFVNAGFEFYRPLPYSQVVAALVSLVPLLWLRTRFEFPSDVLVFQIFLFVFIPSCVYLTVGAPLTLSRQVGIEATLLGGMLLLELRRFMPPVTAIRLPVTPNFYTFVLLGLGILAMAAMGYSNELSLENLDLSNVYERRAELVETQGGTILGYVANWSSFALAPVCLCYGWIRRNWVLVALGVALAVASFAMTSFRSNLFLPLFAVMVTAMMRYAGRGSIGAAMMAVALLLTLLPLALDQLVGGGGFYTWLIHFRFIGNNGFLTAQYFSFFEHAPKGLFQDTFGRFFSAPTYPRPIAEMVGASFSLDGNHANGNLWADGYGNLGVGGVAFASVSLVLVAWLIDSLTINKSAMVGVTAAVVVGFGSTNTAVHSVLTSNGGILLLLLLLILPSGDLRSAPAKFP